jgi:heme-degrading monooxygenase HmoA
MYMRFVRLIIAREKIAEFRKFYDDQVIPALQATDGCLFASLLQTTDKDDESISLTLWTNEEAAVAYESSGLYDQLLDASDRYFAEVSEWRAHLTGDPNPPVRHLQDPEVEAFPVDIAALSGPLDKEAPPRLYMRLVAIRVEAGRFQQLRERYNAEVVPALLATPGCRAVFLAEGFHSHSRALSVTIWDSEEDAVRYEMSGAFDQMIGRISEFFSGLYQWKLSLTPSREGSTISGQDLKVVGYRVVTGGRLLD